MAKQIKDPLPPTWGSHVLVTAGKDEGTSSSSGIRSEVLFYCRVYNCETIPNQKRNAPLRFSHLDLLLMQKCYLS